jgi:hypothetical protein
MHPHRRLAVALGLVLAGCPAGGDPKSDQVPSGPQAFDQAATELTDYVGIVSAYAPYLEMPKREGKYAPKIGADHQHAAYVAGDEIRHAANKMRQFSKSPVVKTMDEALSNLTRSCMNAKEEPGWTKCKNAVAVFDKALADKGQEASTAGSTAKWPRVAPETVTDRIRQKMGPFLDSIQPNEPEKQLLAKLTDPNAKPEDITGTCEAADQAQQAVTKKFDKGPEELHKLSAKHQQRIVGLCAQLGRAAGVFTEVRLCREEEKDPKHKTKKKEELEEREQQCKLACGHVKARLEEGVPAAVFETMQQDYDEYCKELLEKAAKEN